MNQTNIYFYFTPTKQNEEQVNGTVQQDTSSKILQKSSNEMTSFSDPDNQMTQKLLYDSKDPIEDKSIGQYCHQKTLFGEDAEDQQISDETKGVNDIFQKTFDKKDVETEEEDKSLMATQKLIKRISKQNKGSTKQTLKSTCSIRVFSEGEEQISTDNATKEQEVKQQLQQKQKFLNRKKEIISEIMKKRKPLSPTRSEKVNAILNKPSLKDKFRGLLGVLQVKGEDKKEMIELMKQVEQFMFSGNISATSTNNHNNQDQFFSNENINNQEQLRRSLPSRNSSRNISLTPSTQINRIQANIYQPVLLSQLLAQVRGLTIQKMNAIMNVNPQLYMLQLVSTHLGQDMLIQLPNRNENFSSIQQWRQKRIEDYTQRLYFQEQSEGRPQNDNVFTSKLTQQIKDSLQKLELKESISTESEKIPSLKEVSECIESYFSSRSVSNIFKANILNLLVKKFNILTTTAQQLLNQIIHLCPGWLNEVFSSQIGVILRINNQINFQQFLL